MDIYQQKNNGYNVLHLAARYGKQLILDYLVEEHMMDINQQNNEGNTALHLAASNGQQTILEYLIVKKLMKINQKNEKGNTPLHMAVAYEHLDMVNCLISKHKADITEKNNDGNTALHIAVIKLETTDIASYLIMEGADCNEKNNQGDTPLHLAIQYKKYGMIELLIKHGANINEINNGCCTINQLIFSQKNDIDLIKQAVRKGFKAQISDSVEKVISRISTEMNKPHFVHYDATIRYHSLIREISLYKNQDKFFQSINCMIFIYKRLIKLIKLNISLITDAVKPLGTKGEGNKQLVDMIKYYETEVADIGHKIDVLEKLPLFSYKKMLISLRFKKKYGCLTG